MTSLAEARRVVTAHDLDGRSVLGTETKPPRNTSFKHVEGMEVSILWATQDSAKPPMFFHDPVPKLDTMHPPPGGSIFMLLRLPPETVYHRADFDFGAAIEEQLEALPGIVDRFESEAPGFHSTDTIDYVTVVEGEVTLELDDDEIELKKFDTVVQNGTRHAWRNKGKDVATLAVVMMGILAD